jgi:hypothetical protein
VITCDRGSDHLRNQFRRMLQIAVHHDDPLCIRGHQSDLDSATKTTLTDAGWPVNHPDRHRSTTHQLRNGLRSFVIAVIHEEKLSIQAPCAGRHTGDKRRYIVTFVTRGHYHGEHARAPVHTATI